MQLITKTIKPMKKVQLSKNLRFSNDVYAWITKFQIAHFERMGTKISQDNVLRTLIESFEAGPLKATPIDSEVLDADAVLAKRVMRWLRDPQDDTHQLLAEFIMKQAEKIK